MSDSNNLIHAGLPWSNPQKITVKSDQYISQMVINRGLLNLLSNDYYLDLKAQRLNEYVTEFMDGHIDDTDIHLTSGDVYNIIEKYLNSNSGSQTMLSLGLKSNSMYLIPLYKNDILKTITILKNVINSSPKNLNGNTLLFLFCFPISQLSASDKKNARISIVQSETKLMPTNDTITIDLNNDNITFDSFFGGSIIIGATNEFYCDDQNNDVYSQFKGPIVRKTINHIRQLLSNDTDYSDKKVSFVSTSINNKYSVMSFRDCQCDIYLWNLNIIMKKGSATTSVLNNTTNISTVQTVKYPNYFNLIAYYSFKDITSKYVYLTQFNSDLYNNISLKSDLTMYVSDGSIIAQSDSNVSYCNINKASINYDRVIVSDSNYMTSNTSNQLRRLLFGAYNSDGTIVYDQSYKSLNGVDIVFWMNYSNDQNMVPILCDIRQQDSVKNGIYIGLQQVRIIKENKTYAYYTNVFNNTNFGIKSAGWVLWDIHLHCNWETSKTQIKLRYITEKQPNNVINLTYQMADDSNNLDNNVEYQTLNQVPPINNYSPIRVFSSNLNTAQTLQAKVRNFMIFNDQLSEAQLTSLANLGPNVEQYPWRYDQDQQITINNPVYGCLYAYNTKLLNIINCTLKQQ